MCATTGMDLPEPSAPLTGGPGPHAATPDDGIKCGRPATLAALLSFFDALNNSDRFTIGSCDVLATSVDPWTATHWERVCEQLIYGLQCERRRPGRSNIIIIIITTITSNSLCSRHSRKRARIRWMSESYRVQTDSLHATHARVNTRWDNCCG